jgi:exonuclease VII small subunit
VDKNIFSLNFEKALQRFETTVLKMENVFHLDDALSLFAKEVNLVKFCSLS